MHPEISCLFKVFQYGYSAEPYAHEDLPYLSSGFELCWMYALLFMCVLLRSSYSVDLHKHSSISNITICITIAAHIDKRDVLCEALLEL